MQTGLAAIEHEIYRTLVIYLNGQYHASLLRGVLTPIQY
jgi:hypothetical protein